MPSKLPHIFGLEEGSRVPRVQTPHTQCTSRTWTPNHRSKANMANTKPPCPNCQKKPQTDQLKPNLFEYYCKWKELHILCHSNSSTLSTAVQMALHLNGILRPIASFQAKQECYVGQIQALRDYKAKKKTLHVSPSTIFLIMYSSCFKSTDGVFCATVNAQCCYICFLYSGSCLSYELIHSKSCLVSKCCIILKTLQETSLPSRWKQLAWKQVWKSSTIMHTQVYHCWPCYFPWFQSLIMRRFMNYIPMSDRFCCWGFLLQYVLSFIILLLIGKTWEWATPTRSLKGILQDQKR